MTHRALILTLHLAGGVLTCCTSPAFGQFRPLHALWTCDRPELLQVLSLTDSTALLTWSDVADEYELELTPTSVAPSGQPTHVMLPDPPFLLQNLTPGVQYRFAVRAVCAAQDKSAWSLPRNFTTHLNNKRPCPLALSFPDTTCRRFPLQVDEAPGSQLGVDVLLDEVRVVLEHRWRSDLRIFLEAPWGERVQLAGGFNAGDDHLGDPDAGACPPSFIFTDAPGAAALSAVSGVDAPAGYFKPIEPMAMLMTGQDPRGVWILEVCDDKIDDTGVLRACGLQFSATACARPDSVWVTDVEAEKATVHWTPAFPGELLVVEVGPAGFFPGQNSLPGVGGSSVFAVTDTQLVELQGLAPLTGYEAYVRRQCPNGQWSPNGRAVSFFTSCPATLAETADSLSTCAGLCADPCPMTGIWQNVPVGDDFEWKVRSGPGVAWPNAGPATDAGGAGNYFYFRNSCSFNGANGKKAFLRSRCIAVSAPSDAPCHFSFDLYMHTNIGQMGRLDFQVSADGGQSWHTLRSWAGNQTKSWKREYLRLDSLDGQAVLFQFVATGVLGVYGDIAVDNVQFYGSTSPGNPDFIFYKDDDGDGWGVEALSVATCSAQTPPGYAAKAGDCNDADPFTHPGAAEIRCNGKDENCNGAQDDAPPPAPLLRGDTVCAGDTARLAALLPAQGTHYWFDSPAGGSPVFAGDTFLVVNPFSDKMYFVQDSIAGLCAGPRASVVLKALPAPALTGPTALSVCAGESLDLALQGVQDTSGLPGEPGFYSSLPAVPANLLGNTLVEPVGDTVFFAVKTASNGCASVWPMPLDYHVLPNIELPVNDTLELCRGAQQVVSASATSGTPPFAFTWSNGLNGAQITAKAGQMPGALLPYAVSVLDAAGCSDADSFAVLTLGGISQTRLVQVLPATVCGGSDGVIVLEPLDGTPPYHYAWSGPQPGALDSVPAGEALLTGLKPGVYRVSISDASGTGCDMTLPQIVVDAPGFSVMVDTIVHVSCFGGQNGRISLNVNGVNPQIAWNNGQQGVDAVSLPAGTYTATVTVGACSQVLEDLLVDEPPVLALSVNKITAETCKGAANGRIDLRTEGGTAPYEFLWSNGSLLEDSDSLAKGYYNVAVQDAAGCVATLDSVWVPGPEDSLALTIEIRAPIDCFGAFTGRLRAQASGGAPPYTFVWSNDLTVQDLYGLNAGMYSVTVSDVGGCTAQVNVFLDEPDSLLLSLSSTQPTCLGAKNGSIVATTSGGVPPYAFFWNNGGNTDRLDSLDAGAYWLYAEDANGCRVHSDTSVLTAFQIMQLAVDSIADVRCAEAPGGYVKVAILGGASPLNYVWDGVSGSSPELSDAVSGLHLLEVRDAAGCVLRDTFDVHGPSDTLKTTVASLQPAFCAGDPTGSIDVQTAGGTSPYTWLWSSGDTTEDLPAVYAGVYELLVTDANGCTAGIGPLTVGEPPAIQVNAMVSDIPCFGPKTGSIVLTVSGGVAPYAYLWNTGSMANALYGAPAGAYAVTVSDATGCAVVLSDLEIVRKNDLFRAVILSTRPVSCNNTGDGAVMVLAENGRPPYQFSWSAPVGLHPNKLIALDTAMDLQGGAYSVLVTDADGCNAQSDSVFIEEAPTINLGFGGDFQLSCKGDSNAVVHALVSGGLPPYLYLWTNGSQADTIAHLAAGTYGLSITDKQGCKADASIMILEPAQSLEIAQVNIAEDYCAEGEGRIQVWAQGGKQPYFFDWNNGAETAVIDSLYAGMYALTLSDALGCVVLSPEYVVDGPAAPVLIEVQTIVEPDCHGSQTGSISVLASGGYGGYTYFWSGGENGAQVSFLGAGMHTVTAIDAEGCRAAQTINLEEPPAFSAPWDADSLPDGWRIRLNPQGATPPYQVVWSAHAGGQTGPEVTGLASGVYSATITDAHGCVYVAEGLAVGVSSANWAWSDDRVRVFPNPATQERILLVWGGAAKARRVRLFTVQGRLLREWPVEAMETRLHLDGLPPGVYGLMGFEGEAPSFYKRLVLIRGK